MKIIGMGHVGINTGDFEKSLIFYRDILGCKVEKTFDWEAFRMTKLMLPDGGWLELFDYRKPNGRSAPKEAEVGYRHFAFLVDDVEKWEKHLLNHGVTVSSKTQSLEDLGTKGMLCLDPDGIEVELFEML